MTTLDAMMNHDFDPRMINKYLLKGRRQRALAIGKAFHGVRSKLCGYAIVAMKVLAVFAVLVKLFYFAQ